MAVYVRESWYFGAIGYLFFRPTPLDQDDSEPFRVRPKEMLDELGNEIHPSVWPNS
jgi:hypothetical protein